MRRACALVTPAASRPAVLEFRSWLLALCDGSRAGGAPLSARPGMIPLPLTGESREDGEGTEVEEEIEDRWLNTRLKANVRGDVPLSETDRVRRSRAAGTWCAIGVPT